MSSSSSRIPTLKNFKSNARVKWATALFWYVIEPLLQRHHHYYVYKVRLDRILERNRAITNTAIGVTIGLACYVALTGGKYFLFPMKSLDAAYTFEHHVMDLGASETNAVTGPDPTRQFIKNSDGITILNPHYNKNAAAAEGNGAVAKPKPQENKSHTPTDASSRYYAMLPTEADMRERRSLKEDAKFVLAAMKVDETKELPTFQLMRIKREILGRLYSIVDVAEVRRQREELEAMQEMLNNINRK